MRRGSRWAAAGILGLGALAVVLPALRSRLAAGARDDLPTVRVRRETLTRDAVALGSLQPQVGAEVKVGSQVSGIVSRLEVKVGDRVRRGDLLALIDDRQERARVDELRAALASARAARDYARTQLARGRRISDLLPSQELDGLVRDAQARQADVARARAALDQAEIALGRTVIRAPIAGTVAEVSTAAGETVAASLAAPTFVTLLDLDRLEVQVQVDETDIGEIEAGQRATLDVDAFPDHPLPAVVRTIRPQPELVNNVVDYIVVLDLARPAGLPLRPQMTVHARFQLERRDDVLVVPRTALGTRGRGSFVVTRAGPRWVERGVSVGLRTPLEAEIRSGVGEGAEVVADLAAWTKRKENPQ